MIYICTTAYNAAETLPRAVDSVLKQTHKEFCYYLCDNGSIDDGITRSIVKDYARQDNRIVPFYNKNNHVYDGNEELPLLPYSIGGEEFYCSLDADDEYMPTFFEDMLVFVDKYDLDIATCGSDFINAKNNQISGIRKLNQDLILKGDGFGEHLPIYYQFMRTRWGKIFKGKVLRNTVNDSSAPGYPRAYGGDTFFTMRAFRDAQRVGILAKSLHKYYMSASSTSYVMHPERVKSDQILYEEALEYLKPYGRLSAQNDRVIKLVYFYAIKDTLRVLLNARITPLEKMKSIQDIFQYEATKELFGGNYITVKEMDESIRTPISYWLISQKETRTQESIKLTTEILLAMHNPLIQILNHDSLSCLLEKMPELIEGLIKKDFSRVLDCIRIWFERHEIDDIPLTELEIAVYYSAGKTDDELFTLLIDIRNKRPKSSEMLNIDAQIGALLNKYGLLQSINIGLCCAFPKTVNLILQNNYVNALDEFIAASQVVEIDEGNAEACIFLGTNLSAAAEDADAYVYFKKIWASYLLDISNFKEAKTVLDEFEQILPDDEDFIEMRKRLPS